MAHPGGTSPWGSQGMRGAQAFWNRLQCLFTDCLNKSPFPNLIRLLGGGVTRHSQQVQGGSVPGDGQLQVYADIGRPVCVFMRVHTRL